MHLPTHLHCRTESQNNANTRLFAAGISCAEKSVYDVELRNVFSVVSRKSRLADDVGI